MTIERDTGPSARPAAAAALAPNVRGALWMLAAAAAFSGVAVVVKLVGARLDSTEIVFFRILFSLLIILPFAWRRGLAVFRTDRPGLHLLRAFLGFLAMSCMFFAVTHMPLADAVAITFSKPLFVIVLAVIFLGEAVRWRRWTATAVGFAGVLIMLRPNAGTEVVPAVVAVAGAAFIAAVVILVKKLSERDPPLTLMLNTFLIQLVFAAVPAALVWQTPTAAELGWLALGGGCAVLGQLCLIQSCRVGEASAVAPFDYARLIFAGGFGVFLFGEALDVWTVVGAAVIVASTLYIARREARLGRAVPPDAAALGRT